MALRHVTTFPLLLAAIAVFAWPVAGDCQPAGPLEDELKVAPVAFVGTVTDTEGGSARFAVEEVWAGNVGPEVEVRGLGWAEFQPNGARRPVDFGAGDVGLVEDDRIWAFGGRYLVVPWVEGEVLRESACTATTEWRPELAELRPDDAVIFPEAPGSGIPLPLIVAGVAVLVVGLGSAVAFRKG
jgi:hypothetical protein